MRLDAERFAAVVASTIKSALVKLEARLDALEQRGVVHGKDGAPGPQGEKGLDGASGRDGADGAPGPEGPQGPAGPAGEPGADGRDGRDGQPGPSGAPGEKGLDGKDGRDGKDGSDGLHGKDGVDGLGFDDLEAVYDDHGRMSLRFSRGDVVKMFRVPGQVDRGVFKQGESYEQGDGVTWGGSFWIAQAPTTAKPGEASAESRAWRLAVKKGSDGKSGPRGPEGPIGKQGPQGPQGRQGY